MTAGQVRQGDLLPVEYCHVVFTLPVPSAYIAYQNKAVVCGLLFDVAAEVLQRLTPAVGSAGTRTAEIGAVPLADLHFLLARSAGPPRVVALRRQQAQCQQRQCRSRRLRHPIAATGRVAADKDGKHVRCRHEAEQHALSLCGDVEANVCAVGHAARAVVLVPVLVQRRLDLVAAHRQRVGGECISTVTVDVLQPASQAVRAPVARAAQLVLKTAGRCHDARPAVVRDPMRHLVVVEAHVAVGRQQEAEVRTVGSGLFDTCRRDATVRHVPQT